MNNVDNDHVSVNQDSSSFADLGVRKRIFQSTKALATNNPVYRVCVLMKNAVSLTPTARKRASREQLKTAEDPSLQRRRSFFSFRAEEDSKS